MKMAKLVSRLIQYKKEANPGTGSAKKFMFICVRHKSSFSMTNYYEKVEKETKYDFVNEMDEPRIQYENANGLGDVTQGGESRREARRMLLRNED